MATINLKCVHCERDKVVKCGLHPDTGKQRYLCKDCGRRFVNGYTWKANDPKIKELIISMTHNGSGTRDIARVLKVARQTVSNTCIVLKKVDTD